MAFLLDRHFRNLLDEPTGYKHKGYGSAKWGTNPLNVRFGKRLGTLRKQKGWTYTYLSEHSGISPTFLLGIEHGTKEPCLGTLDTLAKSFDLTISELMRGV